MNEVEIKKATDPNVSQAHLQARAYCVEMERRYPGVTMACYVGTPSKKGKEYLDTSFSYIGEEENMMQLAQVVGKDMNGKMALDFICHAYTTMLVHCPFENLEHVITEIEHALQKMRDRRNPLNIERMMKAEIKRLRKEKRNADAEEKQKELDAILDAEARKKAHRLKRIENVRKAREAKALIKAKREAKASRPKQFDPHKAAKKKMQKIQERQAERKKKNAGAEKMQTTRNTCSLNYGMTNRTH